MALGTFTTLPPGAIQPEPSLERLEAIQDFIVKNWPALLETYRDQFIALQGFEVVDSDAHIAPLCERLRGRGLDLPRDVWIEFISDRLKNMVL